MGDENLYGGYKTPVSTGSKLRDEAISRVVENAADVWKVEYKNCARQWWAQLPAGSKFTGETLRLEAKKRGLRDPHHPNAWGGMASSIIRRLLKGGHIKEDGRASASASKSHACSMPQYVKL